jgi:predicted anti-sigma-YlaC factor YlaD
VGTVLLVGDWGIGAMSCRDTIHLICMYLEGKLSPSVQSEIERHLSDCADCRLVLEAATTTLDRYFNPPKVEDDSQAA